MRTKDILEVAKKHHRYTSYEKDVSYDDAEKKIVTEHKVWAFTEDDLKKFVKDIEKALK